MNRTFLFDFAEEMPFLVLRDRIHCLDEVSKTKGDYLSINGFNRGLVRSERIVVWENLLMKQFLEEGVIKKNNQVSQEIDGLRDKYKKIQRASENLENKSRNGVVYSFIKDFLNNWSKAGRLNVPKPSSPPNFNPLSLKTFHSPSARRSVLMEIVESEAVLFINGKCYYTGPVKEPKETKEYLHLKDQTYRLLYHCQIEKFDKIYANRLLGTLERKLNSIFEEQDAINERIRNQYKHFNNLSENFPKENKTHEVGFVKDGNDFYIYKNREPFTITSPNLRKTFQFPKCQLGVKLVYNNGKLNYDVNLNSGRVRILGANTVINGKVSGTVKSLKYNEFLHPASTTTDTNDFPYLCITGEGYQFPEPSGKQSLETCIRQVLNNACDNIDRGCTDSNGSAILYNYLDTSYEKYKNNEVRK
jgi:hypothetical protein